MQPTPACCVCHISVPYHNEQEHPHLVDPPYLRIKSDLIDTYKIINDTVYTMLKQSFLITMKVADEAIRRNYLKEDSRLDIRKFAFSNRTVDRWNSLCECCYI